MYLVLPVLDQPIDILPGISSPIDVQEALHANHRGGFIDDVIIILL